MELVGGKTKKRQVEPEQKLYLNEAMKAVGRTYRDVEPEQKLYLNGNNPGLGAAGYGRTGTEAVFKFVYKRRSVDGI